MSRTTINYCTLTHFDAAQCVISHLPWWVSDAFWLLVVLLALSLIEYAKGFIVTVYQVVVLLFGPGLTLIKQGVNWLYSKVRK